MKEGANIFIHVGAHKTGTTFMQRKVFPFWPNMKYVNDLWFPYLVAVQKGTKYIMSNETLFGRPWARDNDLSWPDERGLVVTALARLFPDGQVLLSLRNHADFILSLYKQYLHEGGVLKLERFYDVDGDSGVIKRDDIKYMDAIDLLQNSFARKPFVFTLEQIRSDLGDLLGRLGRLFGEEPPSISSADRNLAVNEGVRYWQGKILRLLNKIDKRPSSYLDPGGWLPLTNGFTSRYRIDPRSLCQERMRWLSRRPISFDGAYRKRVEDYYGDDWRRTREFISAQAV